jgi:hypothetical protein
MCGQHRVNSYSHNCLRNPAQGPISQYPQSSYRQQRKQRRMPKRELSEQEKEVFSYAPLL